MKYVLIFYLCSFNNVPDCTQSFVAPVEFNNYFDCAVYGYKEAHINMTKLNADMVNENKYAFKFECREINTI